MDPYGDEELATLYDLFYSDYDEDVAMYDGFARRGETASLELGIGTGRIALRLARAGLDVVGIDAAPHMLRRLRAKLTAEPELAKRVRAIECDMRAFFLGERFDLIFCAANTLQHLLTSDDQISAFLSVARHLTTGGVFVAKLDSPYSVDWSENEGSVRLLDKRTDPGTGETVMRFSSRRAVAGTLRTATTRIYDRLGVDGTVRRRTSEYTLKYTTPDELRLVLRQSGLKLLHLYGDHALSPFDEASDSMVFVAGLEG